MTRFVAYLRVSTQTPAQAWMDGALNCETAEDTFPAPYGCPVPTHGTWADRGPPTLGMLRKVPP